MRKKKWVVRFNNRLHDILRIIQGDIVSYDWCYNQLQTFLDYESSTTAQRLLRLFFRHYLVGQENEAQKRKTTFPQSLSEEKAEQELDPDF